MTFHLVNCMERALRHPATFTVPDADMISILVPGDYVKVIFEMDEDSDEPFNGERPWVKITRVPDDADEDEYEGTISNDLIFVPLEFGSPVRFRRQHVADICIA